MSVTNDTPTEAQRNQVPPALRVFLQEHVRGFEGIGRINPESDTARGWKIDATVKVGIRHLPDGFEATSVYVGGSDTTVYVRER